MIELLVCEHVMLSDRWEIVKLESRSVFVSTLKQIIDYFGV